MSQVFIKNSN